MNQAVATARLLNFWLCWQTPLPQKIQQPRQTPSVTPTPLPTDTATATPTPSPTPASPEEWLQQYRDFVLDGLNSISELEFNPAVRRRFCKGQHKNSHSHLHLCAFNFWSEKPWAALAIPRNSLGQSLPLLLWEDSTSQSRFRAQSLLTLLDISSNYKTLLTGVQFGTLRKDDLGAFHLLPIERAAGNTTLVDSLWCWRSQTAGADFVLDWRSSDDPQWLMYAAPAKLEIVEVEGNLLPDIVVDAPVPPEGRLRSLVNPPAVFVEQPPLLCSGSTVAGHLHPSMMPRLRATGDSWLST